MKPRRVGKLRPSKMSGSNSFNSFDKGLNMAAGRVLGVFSHQQNGQIGTITFRKGRLEGSTPGIQSLVDSRLKRFKGDPKLAFESLDGWGNGYLWIKSI